MKRLVLAAALFVLILAPLVSAQEFRGATQWPRLRLVGRSHARRDRHGHQLGHQRGRDDRYQQPGDFSFPLLNPGTYTVTAELSGFKKLVRTGIEVRVADKLGLDLTLDVGAMAETVSVVASSPLLETADRIDRSGHR